MAQIIQIPHSGGEHGYNSPIFPAVNLPAPFNQTNARMTWNTNSHKRKYLFWHGDYVDVNNILQHGDFYFWGEWEPPTYVFDSGIRGNSPRYVHFPIQGSSLVPPNGRAAAPGCGQAIHSCGANTDPCVFGDTFKYIICQQKSSMGCHNNGDMLLFGSFHHGDFRLDTVFVVDKVFPYTLLPGQNPQLGNPVSAEYQNVTVRRIVGPNKPITRWFYRGNTFVNARTPYSFSPAALSVNNQAVLKSRMIIPSSDPVLGSFLNSQSRWAYNSKKNFGQTEWLHLINLCRLQGFVPAVKMSYP